MIFETDRLIIQPLSNTHADAFFDMMGNPNVMNPIPRKAMSRTESNEYLKMLMSKVKNNGMQVWSIIEKQNKNFIGLCAFLTNDENEPEIGYRLRENFWGLGYGTETTEGLIDFGFTTLQYIKITADVSIENSKSVKILEKFFIPIKEFYCEKDDCMDRRYAITKGQWLKK